MHSSRRLNNTSIVFTTIVCILALSCAKTSPDVQLIAVRDSIVRDYLAAIDSSQLADTPDEDFDLVTAIAEYDTAYLLRAVNDVREDTKSWVKAHDSTRSCGLLAPLHTLDVDEAYRFRYEASFCDTAVVVTIARRESNIIMDIFLYRVSALANNCKVHQLEKKLDEKIWAKLLKGVEYADFWALNIRNDKHGFDGSSLYVFGYQKNYYNGRYKVVYRWAPQGTALGSLFKEVVDNSGITVRCLGTSYLE